MSKRYPARRRSRGNPSGPVHISGFWDPQRQTMVYIGQTRLLPSGHFPESNRVLRRQSAQNIARAYRQKLGEDHQRARQLFGKVRKRG